MTQFTLKRQTFPVSFGLSVCLETGTVGHCRMQVPWSSSGDFELDISDVELILRLYINSDHVVVDELKSVMLLVQFFIIW